MCPCRSMQKSGAIPWFWPPVPVILAISMATTDEGEGALPETGADRNSR